MKKLMIICIIAAGLFSCQTEKEAEKVTETEVNYPQAEYDRGAIVVMHDPGDEMVLGAMHPDAALYKCYLNSDSARIEHQGYQNILRNLGVKVYTLREMLLTGCVDEKNNWIECPATDSLRTLAKKAMKFTSVGDLNDEEVQKYKESIIKQYTPNDILRALLLQPEFILKKTDINTGIEAEYKLNPLMNTFFMRDQVISTAKGIVVGKMNSSQRSSECDLVEFGLKRIGKEPIYRIQGDSAFLEGGDFIPMRDYAMIGNGLRTTPQAIQQLMDNDLLGKDTLVVVNDPWKSQIQMHLDTYFNVIDEDLVTLCSNRYNAKQGDKDFLTVTIYVRNAEGKYEIKTEEQSFLEFLAERGIEIIPIQPADEDNFANNFLCIEGREIVMVAGQSEELQKQLKEKGVKVHWAPVHNLTCGYGAAHCMTQMIGRIAPSK